MLKLNQGLILFKKENIFYISKFTGSKSIVFLTANKKYIFLQDKYLTQAREQCKDFEIISTKNINVMEIISNLSLQSSINEIYFEEESISLLQYCELKKLNLALIPGDTLLTEMRIIKSQDELNLISSSCKIVDNAISSVIEKIKLPMTEKQLSLLLEIEAKKLGADSIDFLIISSGKRGAIPHGRPSEKKLALNEFITIDFGVIYKGYHSDITRTFALGNNIDKELLKIYNIVNKAQNLGLSLVKEGVSTKYIDTEVRKFIKKHGYEKFFIHGLGHGVGIEGHELPYLNEKEEYILKENMVITIEPGIYIQDIGGVRIEDTVIVTKDGYINLTPSSKEYKEINLC